MEELLNKVKGCFGNNDLLFAAHPLDRERATELRKEIKAGQVKGEDAELIAYGFLAQQGCLKEHIQEEMSDWKKFFDK